MGLPGRVSGHLMHFWDHRGREWSVLVVAHVFILTLGEPCHLLSPRMPLSVQQRSQKSGLKKKKRRKEKKALIFLTMMK